MIKYYNKLILSLSEITKHPVLLIHGLTGCAFHCFHCFNYKELIEQTPIETYGIEDVLQFVKSQDALYDYIVFSGGEFLRASLDDLRTDFGMIRAASAKPIIIYTTGVELNKMKTLAREGLVDGFHIDMKLPYHLLNEDDFELVEQTMGVAVTNLSLFDKLLDAFEFVVAYDKGYSRIRSVRYPFLHESAFEANRMYVHELNHRYGKNVPYDVNPFIYGEESDN